jgi:ribose transport system permease protein
LSTLKIADSQATQIIWSRFKTLPKFVWPFVTFLALFLVGGLIRPALLTPESLIGTATFAMLLTLASLGQTVALIQGGIDLSVPNTIAFAGLTFLALSPSLGFFGAGLAAIVIGSVIGATSGLIVTKLGLTPIVTTIAINALLFGIILLNFRSNELTQVPQIAKDLTSGQINFFGLMVPAILPIGLVLVSALQLLLSYSGLGRSLVLIGSNQEAARFAGLKVNRIKIAAFVASSALAATAGVFLVGFYGQASSSMGNPYLLGSVAAVVVGGASIFGGSGNFFGTFGGALVLGQVATLVAVANLGANLQQLIYGVIVLAVVFLYGRGQRVR